MVIARKTSVYVIQDLYMDPVYLWSELLASDKYNCFGNLIHIQLGVNFP